MHVNRSKKETPVVFLFPATANSHKNFECLCSATEVLYKRLKKGLFEVYITVKGDENAYGRWLYHKWGMNPALNFTGFLNKQGLYTLYEQADCLVFPSKIETWGLPITEFASYRKPMLLADLSYAHETASECEFVSFFDPNNFIQLADKMEKIIQGNFSEFEKVDKVYINTPVVYSWQELFRLLLS